MGLKVKNSTLMGILATSLIVILSISLIQLYDYTNSLEREITNRDKLIENQNKRDSVLKESVKVVNGIKNGNEDINISELIKYANSLTDEILNLHKKMNLLNDSISYYKIYYNLNQYYFNHKYIVSQNASGGKNYSLDRNAVKKDIYEKCQAKCYNNEKEIQKLEEEIYRYKHALKWYGIQIDKKNNDILYPSPYYAPKVDSALMLLEAYRDKLKYNRKNKTWKVGNRTTISIGVTVDTIVNRNPQPSSNIQLK